MNKDDLQAQEENEKLKESRKIAVIGSREGISESVVRGICDKYIMKNDILISGGAVGVDSFAEKWANDNKIECVIYKPNFEKGFDYFAYFERNRKIVDESDIIVAVWNGTSRGTDYTIHYAKKQDKKVIVEPTIFLEGYEQELINLKKDVKILMETISWIDARINRIGVKFEKEQKRIEVEFEKELAKNGILTGKDKEAFLEQTKKEELEPNKDRVEFLGKCKETFEKYNEKDSKNLNMVIPIAYGSPLESRMRGDVAKEFDITILSILVPTENGIERNLSNEITRGCAIEANGESQKMFALYREALKKKEIV